METAIKPKGITRDVHRGISQIEADRPPNPFSSACRHITRPQRIPIDDKIVGPKPSVKFAFISFDGPVLPHDFKEDFIPLCGQCQGGINAVKCRQEFLRKPPRRKRDCQRGLDLEACGRKLIRPDAVRKYDEALTDALDISGANIVAVNELGIPANSTGPSTQFFTQAKSWAYKTSSLIITGSFHDERTKYNTGYIFTPESPDEGYAFHKQVSATNIGEYISVPPRRRSMIVPAFGFNIGVIICLDLLDYSTIATLVDMRDAIDFILVPACSSDAQGLERVAKIASQAMPGGVGIVNYNRGQTRSSTMHIFGVQQQPVVDQQLTGGTGWLTVYEVDWLSFRTEKLRRQDIERNLDWLFRFPSIDLA